MPTDPSDLVFVICLVIFVWLVLAYIDSDGGGGKRSRIPAR